MRWSRNGGQKKDVYFFCNDSKKSGSSPDKRRKYDEAFKAEALRLASESRSTQAAARELGISPKLLFRSACPPSSTSTTPLSRPSGTRCCGWW
ncbi:transposase [Hymenobacter sp. J193]|uniref:transposase n=1 Tax=Hymenobacter sp. J193 TaxID=2898429 RepID=UPI0035B28AEE